jgi:hypothetical protein
MVPRVTTLGARGTFPRTVPSIHSIETGKSLPRFQEGRDRCLANISARQNLRCLNQLIRVTGCLLKIGEPRLDLAPRFWKPGSGNRAVVFHNDAGGRAAPGNQFVRILVHHRPPLTTTRSGEVRWKSRPIICGQFAPGPIRNRSLSASERKPAYRRVFCGEELTRRASLSCPPQRRKQPGTLQGSS